MKKIIAITITVIILAAGVIIGVLLSRNNNKVEFTPAEN